MSRIVNYDLSILGKDGNKIKAKLENYAFGFDLSELFKVYNIKPNKNFLKKFDIFLRKYIDEGLSKIDMALLKKNLM